MSQTAPIAMSGSHAQSGFGNHHEMDSPPSSTSDYARIMHEHTKRQLSTATSSARRRSQGLSSPGSPTSSVSSTSS